MTATIRHFSRYQLNYLTSLHKYILEKDKEIKIDLMNVGRVDETGEMILEYIQFGKINKIVVPVDPPEYT